MKLSDVTRKKIKEARRFAKGVNMIYYVIGTMFLTIFLWIRGWCKQHDCMNIAIMSFTDLCFLFPSVSFVANAINYDVNKDE